MINMLWIYFIPIFTFAVLNYRQTVDVKILGILIALMWFLCFGYMTGSDWRAYEFSYYNNFSIRLVEPGYMLLSNVFRGLEIPFFVFHILFKCISYVLIVGLIVKMNTHKFLFFSLMLWYASFGLYMFIDCPFRNLIACGVASVAFYVYFQKDKKGILEYYFLSILAMSFHLSAVILLIVPFFKLDKIKSVHLITLYLFIFIVLSFGGQSFLSSIINAVMPTFVVNKLDSYLSDTDAGLFTPGMLPRLLCLFLMFKHRSRIISFNKYGKHIFNLAYLYLLLSLVYYIIPMLFRSALFLAPFYVSIFAIAIFLSQSLAKLKIKMLVLILSCAIVYTTITSYKYVPYTNIIYNCITGDFYDYSFRELYNYRLTPYKDSIDK